MVFRITHVISIVSITCHALITCWLSQLNKNSSSQLTRHYHHHPSSQNYLLTFTYILLIQWLPFLLLEYILFLRAFFLVILHHSITKIVIIKVMGWFYVSTLSTWWRRWLWWQLWNQPLDKLFIALLKMFEWLIYDHVFPRSLICWLWHRQISRHKIK